MMNPNWLARTIAPGRRLHPDNLPVRTLSFIEHTGLDSTHLLAADGRWPQVCTILRALTTVSGIGLGLVRQPQPGQRHAAGEAEFLQRRTASNRLG